ncbi:hypothetical protein [Rugamonas sp.]|uniref:hypothetical protein n=1 Tax=Rugamonas sp. TaxID=1926287 RepID=UPI0025D3C0C9|nr:hypothetical protein [Rugamonas sp.]
MPRQDEADTVGSTRYLIRAKDDAPINDVLTELADDPDVELVDLIGPRDRPHTAVVDISADKARDLVQRFISNNQQVIIEPDRPLSPLG